MRAFLGTVLSVIAVGVLLIAYGLLAPRAGAYSPSGAAAPVVFDPGTGTYQLARPMPASERFEIGADGRLYGTPSDGAASQYVAAVPASNVVTYVPAARPVTVASTTSAPRQVVRRPATVDRGRDWKKTAMIIGGSSAAGAGVGAIFGGRKGAAIGAAIAGGGATLYEVTKR